MVDIEFDVDRRNSRRTSGWSIPQNSVPPAEVKSGVKGEGKFIRDAGSGSEGENQGALNQPSESYPPNSPLTDMVDQVESKPTAQQDEVQGVTEESSKPSKEPINQVDDNPSAFEKEDVGTKSEPANAPKLKPEAMADEANQDEPKPTAQQDEVQGVTEESFKPSKEPTNEGDNSSTPEKDLGTKPEPNAASEPKLKAMADEANQIAPKPNDQEAAEEASKPSNEPTNQAGDNPSLPEKGDAGTKLEPKPEASTLQRSNEAETNRNQVNDQPKQITSVKPEATDEKIKPEVDLKGKGEDAQLSRLKLSENNHPSQIISNAPSSQEAELPSTNIGEGEAKDQPKTVVEATPTLEFDNSPQPAIEVESSKLNPKVEGIDSSQLRNLGLDFNLNRPQVGTDPNLSPTERVATQPTTNFNRDEGLESTTDKPNETTEMNPNPTPTEPVGKDPIKNPNPIPNSLKPETNPTTQEGVKSETNPTTQEGVKSETNPTTQEGVKSETNPTTQEGVKSETNPTTQEGVKPETNPTTQEGVKSETNPTTQEGVKPETNPTAQEGAKPETNPTTQEGVKSETNPTTQEGGAINKAVDFSDQPNFEFEDSDQPTTSTDLSTITHQSEIGSHPTSDVSNSDRKGIEKANLPTLLVKPTGTDTVNEPKLTSTPDPTINDPTSTDAVNEPKLTSSPNPTSVSIKGSSTPTQTEDATQLDPTEANQVEVDLGTKRPNRVPAEAPLEFEDRNEASKLKSEHRVNPHQRPQVTDPEGELGDTNLESTESSHPDKEGDMKMDQSEAIKHGGDKIPPSDTPPSKLVDQRNPPNQSDNVITSKPKEPAIHQGGGGPVTTNQVKLDRAITPAEAVRDFIDPIVGTKSDQTKPTESEVANFVPKERDSDPSKINSESIQTPKEDKIHPSNQEKVKTSGADDEVDSAHQPTSGDKLDPPNSESVMEGNPHRSRTPTSSQVMDQDGPIITGDTIAATPSTRGASSMISPTDLKSTPGDDLIGAEDKVTSTTVPTSIPSSITATHPKPSSISTLNQATEDDSKPSSTRALAQANEDDPKPSSTHALAQATEDDPKPSSISTLAQATEDDPKPSSTHALAQATEDDPKPSSTHALAQATEDDPKPSLISTLAQANEDDPKPTSTSASTQITKDDVQPSSTGTLNQITEDDVQLSSNLLTSTNDKVASLTIPTSTAKSITMTHPKPSPTDALTQTTEDDPKPTSTSASTQITKDDVQPSSTGTLNQITEDDVQLSSNPLTSTNDKVASLTIPTTSTAKSITMTHPKPSPTDALTQTTEDDPKPTSTSASTQSTKDDVQPSSTGTLNQITEDDVQLSSNPLTSTNDKVASLTIPTTSTAKSITMTHPKPSPTDALTQTTEDDPKPTSTSASTQITKDDVQPSSTGTLNQITEDDVQLSSNPLTSTNDKVASLTIPTTSTAKSITMTHPKPSPTDALTQTTEDDPKPTSTSASTQSTKDDVQPSSTRALTQTTEGWIEHHLNYLQTYHLAPHSPPTPTQSKVSDLPKPDKLGTSLSSIGPITTSQAIDPFITQTQADKAESSIEIPEASIVRPISIGDVSTPSPTQIKESDGPQKTEVVVATQSQTSRKVEEVQPQKTKSAETDVTPSSPSKHPKVNEEIHAEEAKKAKEAEEAKRAEEAKKVKEAEEARRAEEARKAEAAAEETPPPHKVNPDPVNVFTISEGSVEPLPTQTPEPTLDRDPEPSLKPSKTKKVEGLRKGPEVHKGNEPSPEVQPDEGAMEVAPKPTPSRKYIFTAPIYLPPDVKVTAESPAPTATISPRDEILTPDMPTMIKGTEGFIVNENDVGFELRLVNIRYKDLLDDPNKSKAIPNALPQDLARMADASPSRFHVTEIKPNNVKRLVSDPSIIVTVSISNEPEKDAIQLMETLNHALANRATDLEDTVVLKFIDPNLLNVDGGIQGYVLKKNDDASTQPNISMDFNTLSKTGFTTQEEAFGSVPNPLTNLDGPPTAWKAISKLKAGRSGGPPKPSP
ncbi:hypothetical protein L0F63_003934 [Massospora cicadina]|nr:hypothetical protein L0F63_003934 [Massospora cicadina]